MPGELPFDTWKIPVYAINLARRRDRKNSIINEFSNLEEFDFSIVEAVEHDIGAVGLWLSIKKIISNLVIANSPLAIICEDDHQFTSSYDKNLLLDAIKRGYEKDADVILGGVHWYDIAIQATGPLFWVHQFTGAQFTVVFRKFYETIENAAFNEFDAADLKISTLSDKIFFINPFISVQKEFGYSDVTDRNNKNGRITALFNNSQGCVQNIDIVGKHFKNLENTKITQENIDDCSGFFLSTYLLVSNEDDGRYSDFIRQFDDKPEFRINVTEIVPSPTTDIALLSSIKNIIKYSIALEEDVVAICFPGHRFSPSYSKENFFQNIIAAHERGTDILLGGLRYFSQAVVIAQNYMWIDAFYGSMFLVIYSKVFDDILNINVDTEFVLDEVLSELTSNKLLLYPNISTTPNDICTTRLNNECSIGFFIKPDKYINTAAALDIIYLKTLSLSH